ncbi:MAG: ABC-three component system middle component 6 [Myxococcota bacterium]|nr:ABC-three component system middle component 6 [Myxococcota bacterium]
MILPTKHIPAESALLGLGGRLLAELVRPRTVSSLWEAVKDRPEIGTFQRFTLALDLLFAIGAVSFRDGLLVRMAG